MCRFLLGNTSHNSFYSDLSAKYLFLPKKLCFLQSAPSQSQTPMLLEYPYQVGYAVSSKSSCKRCRKNINQECLRLAQVVQSVRHDGNQLNWYHEDCFFRSFKPDSLSMISKLDLLRNLDRKRIKEKVEQPASCSSQLVEPINKGKRKNTNAEQCHLDFCVKYSESNGTSCNVCSFKICKDELLIGKILNKFGEDQLFCFHAQCFIKAHNELGFHASGELLPGFKDLSKKDQAILKNNLPSMPTNDTPLKKPKADENEVEIVQEKNIESELENQNDLFFKYRDSLCENFSKKQLQHLLELNSQHCPKGLERILDLLADVISFGALKPCPICKYNEFTLDNHGYFCMGNASEWSKCTYSTKNPERVPFEVPEGYAKFETFQHYNAGIGRRVFEDFEQPLPLKELDFFIYNDTESFDEHIKQTQSAEEDISHTHSSKKDITNKILELGGHVAPEIHKQIAAVVATKKDVEKMSQKMQGIKQMKIAVVEESFFDSVDKKIDTVRSSLNLITEHNIALWSTDPNKRLLLNVINGQTIFFAKPNNSQKLIIKNASSVDPDSGLEDVGHVYIDEHGTKWEIVLNKTDIVAKKNSYYKLQLIEAKTGGNYWIFRSWGRTGTSIGGSKTNQFESLNDAKLMFEECHFAKTGHYWDFKDSITKLPEKRYPVDLDYGDNYNPIPMKIENNCQMPIPVQQLVITIFDLNSFKHAYLEFNLDIEKMPLGKLSKNQRAEAYKLLSSLLDIVGDTTNKENSYSKIIDATNKFYTLIPHAYGVNNPPTLNNYKIIKSKIDLLDNLEEIEIAFNLMKKDFDSSKLSSVEAHYLQLKTKLLPLDVNSPEFEMWKKYVANTHNKTYSNYELEIEHAFKVDREEEESRYKPFKKLHNRRFLWHGSRTTNFAGILSQGLRIAPPEAPSTGYMFGKGIYFADMAAKSAKYCHASEANPKGVLLICEVALGNMKECNCGEFIESLPAGTHSVIGMGATIPNPAQDVVLEDKTIVPLGRPIKRKLKTVLKCNEFIVYNEAQVKIKYLLQIKFNYS